MFFSMLSELLFFIYLTSLWSCQMAWSLEDRVKAVELYSERGPLSVRRLSTRTGTPRSTVHDVLRQMLGLFPYNLQLLQRLKRGDKAKRLRFCRWALPKWRKAGFQNFLLMTDEAQFRLDGSGNKQNCRIWGTENPGDFLEQ